MRPRLPSPPASAVSEACLYTLCSSGGPPIMLPARFVLLAAGALCCAALPARPAHAQQPTGTIAGQAIDSASREPLPGVTVVVEGTRLGTVSRDDGTFTIGGVPAGTYAVRARRIGYGSAVQTV